MMGEKWGDGEVATTLPSAGLWFPYFTPHVPPLPKPTTDTYQVAPADVASSAAEYGGLAAQDMEMISSQSEQIISLSMGLLFTLLGGLKAYGLCKGYEGGPGKGFWEKLRAGSCPEGHCRLPNRLRKPFYVMLSLFFLGFGLYCLGVFFTIVFA